jgi:hypothetical protein
MATVIPFGYSRIRYSFGKGQSSLIKEQMLLICSKYKKAVYLELILVRGGIGQITLSAGDS